MRDLTARRLMHLRALLRRFGRDDRGATAIEYGLMLTMIAAACVVSMNAVGTSTRTVWDNVGNTVGNAMK